MRCSRLLQVPDGFEREADHDPGRLHRNSKSASRAGSGGAQNHRPDVAGSVEKTKKATLIGRKPGGRVTAHSDWSPRTGFIQALARLPRGGFIVLPEHETPDRFVLLALPCVLCLFLRVGFGMSELRGWAFAAVDEAADQSTQGPVHRSIALRFALAFLSNFADERWPFDNFWRAIANPNERGRWPGWTFAPC